MIIHIKNKNINERRNSGETTTTMIRTRTAVVTTMMRSVLCLVVILLCFCRIPSSTLITVVDAFTFNDSRTLLTTPSAFCTSSSISRTSLNAVRREKKTENKMKKNNNKKKTSTTTTIGDLKKELLTNQEHYYNNVSSNEKQKKINKRARQRVVNPKQKYVYASQRSRNDNDNDNDNNSDDDSNDNKVTEILELTKKAGLSNPANQHCEPIVGAAEPKIVGRIRVQDEEENDGTSGKYAFLIDKPQGWSISGGKSLSKKKRKIPSSSTEKALSSNTKTLKQIKFKNKNGKKEFLKYDESEIMHLLSPEEKAMIASQGDSYDSSILDSVNKDADYYDDKSNDDDVPDIDEADILVLLSAEEREAYEANEMKENHNKRKSDGIVKKITMYDSLERREGIDPSTVENIKRIKARLENKHNNDDGSACFSSYQRPSILSWLKEKKAEEGNPIRGGKFWTALAGATDVDDSGLVLVCPKKNTNNIFVEYSEYVAVLGNNGVLSSKLKKGKNVPADAVEVDVISKLRKNRVNDVSQTMRFIISDMHSTCASVINHAQTQGNDGIRGDPGANPLDRMAPRRLIHCNSMAISSLLFDESIQAETAVIPDDISILSDRLNNHNFMKGSFLGRQSLRNNPLTNAYREINGKADGHPGWTVDRYGDWLFVQHDEKERRGPLPSIHDGYTTGVYLLPSLDHGAMGSKTKIRPILLEGQEAPDVFPILENGITYHVSLKQDLSTGIFLDQRAHRAWLSRYCNDKTHILNCFAHSGAFTISAATSGASTVSLDLNKKWLDRIEPQLEANGIEFDERHDCIYGDVFEWLPKLSKRGEKFDLVILDPPSSSVGKKKKRWSVNRDMAELVQLAAPLVKKGGLLWTSTNNASLSTLKFMNLCQSGLERSGIQGKLERIQPMSVDFPSIGSQPVKNLVWRINK